jgi:dTDP-4-dehydrorhamnose reductase
MVLGVNGLIGNTVFRVLSDSLGPNVYGTLRSDIFKSKFSNESLGQLISGVEIYHIEDVVRVLNDVKPSVVINCIGATKHIKEGNDSIKAVELNSIWPHKLSALCELIGSRLIHISTDCVFSGKKGMYTEQDLPDANDVYGRSKVLGEVFGGNSLTLRTSTIGHELNTNFGLLNWFLSQENSCNGYSKAVFSGMPTVTFAEVIRDYVINDSSLSGLYHIAAEPINKYELLKLISKVYKKDINIHPDDKLVIDRSLDSAKFFNATGYKAPSWQNMLESMYKYK